MMIKTRKECCFYIMADRMMNRGVFTPNIRTRLRQLLFKDRIMDYLVCMRRYAYYKNTPPKFKFLTPVHLLLKGYYKARFESLGVRLGFCIGENCLGYGAVFHHHGNIVVGSTNRIGNYAILHTSTCIVNAGSKIGDAFFLGAGTIISKNVEIGDNVVVAAHSLVNHSFQDGHCLIAGSPAKEVKKADAWYKSLYSPEWNLRQQRIESLKNRMGL